MREFSPKIAEDSPIIALQSLENGKIGVVAASKAVFHFDLESGEILHHFRSDELQPTAHGTAFSRDGSRFAFAHKTSKGYAVRIIDPASKKLLRSYATQENPVELLAFDPTGTYLIAGTTTGRVFLWRTDGNNLIARLSSFPEYTPHVMALPKENFVSAAAFYDYLLATTGYGGSIVVTNVHTLANTKRIKPGKARIEALIFLDERRLVAGNEDGVLMLIHTDEHHNTRRIGTGIGPIKHLLTLPYPRFILAASTFNHIALIDIEAMEVIDKRFISLHSPIRGMTLTANETLLIGMENGEVVETPLSPFCDFDLLLKEARYPEAYGLCDAEPYLKLSRRFSELETAFDTYYAKAHRFLSEGRREDAHALLLPYMKTASKAKQVQALFVAFDHYPRLRHLISEQKYATAYSLSTQHLPLRGSPVYKQMEELWQKAYMNAQKLALKGNDKEARQSFGNFLTVPEKSPYIRLLLQNKAVLIAFAKALKSKDYVALKKLTEREPILKDTPSYKAAMQNADTNIEEIMEAIKAGQFDKAELLCNELLRVPHLAHHHEKVSRFIEKSKKLSALYKSGQNFALYEMLDHFPDLEVLPIAKEAEVHWNSLVKGCEEAALKGNAAAIKMQLGDMITLSSRSDKIGNLLRTAYQMQIKALLARKAIDPAGYAIEHYIDLFGIDNEIRLLIQLLNTNGEDIFLSDEQLQNRPRSLWLAKTEGKVPDRLNIKPL